MVLPTPPSNTQPIPNDPFYSDLSSSLSGPNGPLVVGSGLEINYTTGVISATGTNTGGTVTQINTGVGLIGGPITVSGTLSLEPLVPNPVGNYTYITHIDVDSYGRVTFLQSGAEPVYKTAFNARGALLVGSAASTYSALPPGFTNQVLTADTACPLGVKWAPAQTSGVEEITGTSPILVTGGTTASATVAIEDASLTQKGAVQLSDSLALTSNSLALTAGAGKNLQDQITSLNINKGTVQEVTAALPLYVTGIATTNPQVHICPASLTQSGAVQLYNLTNSMSDSLALTASAGHCLQQQIDTLSSATNLTLAGTIDAATGLVDEVTAVGLNSGFVSGDPLPAPSALLRDYYVIVTTPGTFTPTGGSTPLSFIQGDWVVNDGSDWVRFAVGITPLYASETSPGVVCLATNALTQAGTSALEVVTPASLQSKLSDDPSLASSTSIASSQALSVVNALATDAVLCSDFAGKGYTVSGSGVGTVTALAPGADGQVLSANSAAAGGLAWVNPVSIPSATESVEGTVFLATAAETQAGTDTTNKAINPAALQSKVIDSVACDSSEFIASSKAVKVAYDTAVSAQTSPATDITSGTVCLATNAEVLAGTNSTKAITPTGLQSKVTDSVAITCSNLVASATAVKCAYDAAIVAQNPAYATTVSQGVVCLATNADTQAGVDATKAVTPTALHSNISSCVNSTSETTIASSAAVKTAYDAAVAAVTPSATTTVEGKVCLATNAEVQAGTDSTKAIVSSALQSKISNAIDCASGTSIASSSAVKAAYDLAAAAIPVSTLTAKGALISATGAGIAAPLDVGSDGQFLVADSTCLTGLKWYTLPATPQAAPTAAGVVFGYTCNTCANVALGFCTLNANVGADNTLVGDRVLIDATNISTLRNTLIGAQAMSSPGAGIALDNTMVGYRGMYTPSASDRCGNTGLGAYTFSSLSAGQYNTFIGHCSGLNQASGSYNVAIGGTSIQLPNVTGSCQLAIGYDTNNYWITGCSDRSITIPGGIRDCAGSIGAVGCVLESTGSGVVWATPGGGGGGAPLAYGEFILDCSNYPIANGLVNTPVCFTGSRNTVCNLTFTPTSCLVGILCSGVYNVIVNIPDLRHCVSNISNEACLLIQSYGASTITCCIAFFSKRNLNINYFSGTSFSANIYFQAGCCASIAVAAGSTGGAFLSNFSSTCAASMALTYLYA